MLLTKKELAKRRVQKKKVVPKLPELFFRLFFTTYASIIHTFFVSLQHQILKCMAKNLLNKYVWLVETIYKAKKISFEEINRRWLDNDMSEDKPLSIRTFHKWRIAIEEMFGLIIENEQSGQYRYYIQNADELRSGSMRSWLFNTLTVSNLMLDSVSIKDKVLFEEIPDGEQYNTLYYLT